MEEEKVREYKAVVNGSGISMKIITALLLITFIVETALNFPHLNYLKITKPVDLFYLPFETVFAALTAAGLLIAGVSHVKVTEYDLSKTAAWKCGTTISRIGCILLAVGKTLKIILSFSLYVFMGIPSVIYTLADLFITLYFCVFILNRADDAAGTLKGRFAKTGPLPAILSLIWFLAAACVLISTVFTILTGGPLLGALAFLFGIPPYYQSFFVLLIIVRTLLFIACMKWYASSKMIPDENEPDDYELL